MDALYTAIKSMLDSLIPTANLSTYEDMNNIFAYIITMTVIYLFLLKPLLKLIGIVKKWFS